MRTWVSTSPLASRDNPHATRNWRCSEYVKHSTLSPHSPFVDFRDSTRIRGSDAAAPLKHAWATPCVMCGTHTLVGDAHGPWAIQGPIVSPGR